MIKYTPQLLKKIEEVFTDHGFSVRYDKGNFKSGSCLLEDRKMVVINKFSVIESRINSLLEILRTISPQFDLSDPKYDQVRKLIPATGNKVEEISE